MGETFTRRGRVASTMVEAEQVQEGAMWVVILAAAVLAAARFADYVSAVRAFEVSMTSTVAWWSMYVLALGLIVVGMLGQSRPRRERGTSAWLALLVGILILVIMPANPATSTGAIGSVAVLVGRPRPGP